MPDRDLQAPWVDEIPDFLDEEEYEDDEYIYDEDFEYESARDMEYEDSL